MSIYITKSIHCYANSLVWQCNQLYFFVWFSRWKKLKRHVSPSLIQQTEAFHSSCKQKRFTPRANRSVSLIVQTEAFHSSSLTYCLMRSFLARSPSKDMSLIHWCCKIPRNHWTVAYFPFLWFPHPFTLPACHHRWHDISACVWSNMITYMTIMRSSVQGWNRNVAWFSRIAYF